MNVVMDLKKEVKIIKREFESTENLNINLKNRLDSQVFLKNFTLKE